MSDCQFGTSNFAGFTPLQPDRQSGASTNHTKKLLKYSELQQKEFKKIRNQHFKFHIEYRNT